jgi:hypothetical protein
MLLLVPFGARAGDYGLGVSDGTVKPCEHPITWDLNYCSTETVLDELRKRHLLGEDYTIDAIRVGMRSCRVWLNGKSEKTQFYGSLAEMLASQDLRHEDELGHLIGCFRFEGMRQALRNQLSRPLSDTSRRRVSRMLSSLSKE